MEEICGFGFGFVIETGTGTGTGTGCGHRETVEATASTPEETGLGRDGGGIWLRGTESVLGKWSGAYGGEELGLRRWRRRTRHPHPCRGQSRQGSAAVGDLGEAGEPKQTVFAFQNSRKTMTTTEQYQTATDHEAVRSTPAGPCPQVSPRVGCTASPATVLLTSLKTRVVRWLVEEETSEGREVTEGEAEETGQVRPTHRKPTHRD